MFDLSWGKMLIIGVMALVLIPPKDLPGTLRALGQMVGKIKRMAGEFRSQFDEALREADVASLKKEFDSMGQAASSASSFNPVESIRNEIKASVEGTAAPSAGGDPLPDPVIAPPEPAPPVDHAAFAPPAAPLDVTPPADAPAVAQASADPVKPPANPTTKPPGQGSAGA